MITEKDAFLTHEANEKVWNVLSQPWLAWPLSAEGLRTNLAGDIFVLLAVAEVEEFLRKALVEATERSVEGRRANSSREVACQL